MRKRAFISALTAVATAACIALTGCTAGQASLNDEVDQLHEISNWQAYFNRETGKITAVFDTKNPEKEIYRDETFDEKTDLALPFDFGDNSGANTLESTLDIKGQSYPTTFKVYWSLDSMDRETKVMYYNKFIASAETVTALAQAEESAPTRAFTLESTVLHFVEEQVMSNAMPTPQFATSGKATVQYGPDFLVQGYANGVAPKDLVLELTGSAPNANTEYVYSFNCATYEIVLANEDELESWANQLSVNTDGVRVGIWYSAEDAIVATEAPCNISQKGPIENGQLNPPMRNSGETNNG